MKWWIGFYLWRHLGRPIYVGQSSDSRERSKQQLRLSSKSALSRFIRENFDECVFEDLDLKIWDTRQGRWANAVENALMDLYGTLAPSGFNACHSAERGPDSASAIGAKNQSRDDKVKGGRIAGAIMRDQHHDILVANARKYGPRAASIGGKRRIELHGNPATAEGCLKGAQNQPREAKILGNKKAIHNRWHVSRGLINPNCELCQTAVA